MDQKECQFPSLQGIAEGNAPVPPQSIFRRLRLFVLRHLSPRQDRALHQKANTLIDCFMKLTGKNSSSAEPVTNVQTEHFNAGDLVRVRSKEEIIATLDYMGRTKGCGFMDVMEPYCGTVQRVLKPMERFVNERDLRVKKCSGLVLLEGVICEGVTAFGRCDRCCFMFWREEWLEKIG